MKGKGFTLVELLAVIVILAIVLAIAVPSITGLIHRATIDAFSSDAKMVLKAIDYKLLETSNYNIEGIDRDKIKIDLELGNNNYESVSVSMKDNQPYIIIVGQNKWDDLVACGTYTNMIVGDGSECDGELPTPTPPVIVNEPIIEESMSPIKWDETEEKWVETTTGDEDWYDYANGEWANAQTIDGSYWVWIPRYAYKITSGWHCNDITCEKFTVPNGDTGNIEISFSDGIDDTKGGTVAIVDTCNYGDYTVDTECANDSNGTWTNHPAFTFGEGIDKIELTGIWVAKFETSIAETEHACYINSLAEDCNDDTLTPKVVPNAISWRAINIGNIFEAIRNMATKNIYGWDGSGNGIDTHLIKNTEWGAVAYLSQSIYGKNDEIWINPSDNRTTGCAGSSASADVTEGCQFQYHTGNGQEASTTGNIYGIYDMSGGSAEYVSAYINNGADALTNYGSNILAADAKYKDVYQVDPSDDAMSNYLLSINKKGDAIYETSECGGTGYCSWYDDYGHFPSDPWPWFERGGSNNSANESFNGSFHFSGTPGGTSPRVGSRIVLLVDDNL